MTGRGRVPGGSGARRERAERILDAAADLLVRHGYRRVSIDDVATAVRIGKGTIYLHWKTREALFYAVLQREAMWLLDSLLDELAGDAGLALPDRLMPAILTQVSRRPLVKALLVNDAEVLGALATDESVAAAQREMGGNPDYLGLLYRHGLLRPGLAPADGDRILGAVMRGFFAEPGEPGLLGYVLARTLMADAPFEPDTVAAFNADVTEMFRAISAAQKAQLESAY